MLTIKNLNIKNPNFKNPPKELILESPLTILTGSNGSGKSTLLNAIKKSVKKTYENKDDMWKFYNVYDFSSSDSLNEALNAVQINDHRKKPKVIIAEFDAYSTNDFHHMLGMAMCISHMSTERTKYSEGQLRLIDIKRLLNMIQEIQKADASIPFFVFLDAIDSGLSPDLAYQLRLMLIEFIEANSNIHIIITANTFELINSYQATSISKLVTIIDVNTQTKMNDAIHSYQEYFNYCCAHSSFDERVINAESIIYK